MEVKAWQKFVIVGGLVVGVGLIAWNTLFAGGNGANLNNSLVLLDVTTGKAYRADPSRDSLMFPDRCPETGKFTLVPVIEQDGKWRVPERRLGSIAQCEGEIKAVDAKSGEVTVEVRDIRTFRRKAAL